LLLQETALNRWAGMKESRRGSYRWRQYPDE
jgi:hypothetical protein